MQNSADTVTRGVSAKHLDSSEVWWNELEWLSKEKTFCSNHVDTSNFRAAELEGTRVSKVAVLSGVQVIDHMNYSTDTRLHIVTAWVVRYIHNVRNAENKAGYSG